MSTQQVTYCTYKSLDCCPVAEVILCIPIVLTVTGLGFIDATMTAVTQVSVSCSNSSIQYTFEYDDAQLLDPETPLTGIEISGVICRDCLTRWVEELISYQPFT